MRRKWSAKTTTTKSMASQERINILTEYYCDKIFGEKIPRHKIRSKRHKKDPIVKSSNFIFPATFTHEEVSHTVGKSLNLENWCKDTNVKKLAVLSLKSGADC